MIKGVKIELANTVYTVPPASLAILEDFEDRISKMNGDFSREDVRTVIDLGLATMQRNYPAMTREELAGMLDISNMNDFFMAMMDASGMRRKQQEVESLPPGEPEK